VEDITTGQLDKNFNELTIPTPAIVLEAAINEEKKSTSAATGEEVLLSEVVKPTAGNSAASLKTLPIDTSIDRIPTEKVKTEPVETVKVVVVPVQTNGVIQTPASLATSGNTAQLEANPVTNTINSQTINQTQSLISSATEKQVLNSVINNLTSSTKMKEGSNNSINSIVNSGLTLMNELKSAKEFSNKPINDLISIKEFSNKSVNDLNSVKSSSDKSVIDRLMSTKDLLFSSFVSPDFKLPMPNQGVNFGEIDSVLAAVGKSADSAFDTIDSAKSKLSTELASVKSSKLADSNSVKQLLTPDKTLEKSVSKLTRELPESINNLSSSFSTFSPQSSSTTNVTNEGAKIDQSSTVNSMQPSNRQVVQQDAASQQANSQTGINQSEFYMQAIYAALMSGKIRVKLEQV
jgi:hypothetical protein